MLIERHQTLITLGIVKDLVQDQLPFRCRYDLVELGPNDKPRYSCVYLVGEDEKILISERATVRGVEPRLFILWPGLFGHHKNYGDGTELVFFPDHTIATAKFDQQGNLISAPQALESLYLEHYVKRLEHRPIKSNYLEIMIKKFPSGNLDLKA